MRFMIFRMADDQTEAGVMPTAQLLCDMQNYIGEMAAAGVLIDGDGLKPSSNSKRIKFTGGKPEIIDGPFAETKELVAGYLLIKVESEAEAIEWLKRWPALDANGNVQLEMRPLFEPPDFGDEFTPELREEDAKLRAGLTNN